MYAGEGVRNSACKRHGRVSEVCGGCEPIRRRNVEADCQRNRLGLPPKGAEDSQQEAEGRRTSATNIPGSVRVLVET